MTAVAQAESRRIGVLLRGEPDSLIAWVNQSDVRRVATCVGVIVVGAGLYGAAMGWWRPPLQALFVSIKFPLIILLTTMGNTLLNAMLAPLLGLNLGLRQSFLAILLSFTIACAILGSFSPLVAFFVWNAPPMSPDVPQSSGVYSFIMLMHVSVIAFSGIAGNLRLLQLLQHFSGGNRVIARRVLFASLGGNLFLGSQLSWVLRPFIGSPGLAVEFLRKDAFHGNFYETVFQSWLKVLTINQ